MVLATKQKTLFDYDYRGEFDLSGNLKKVYNEDALINGLTMWFSSLSGELVRYPAWGGYLYDMIYKPMREEDVDIHYMSIRDGFEQNFTPYCSVESLDITPNFAERKWEIDLIIFVEDFNYKLNFSGSLANLA